MLESDRGQEDKLGSDQGSRTREIEIDELTVCPLCGSPQLGAAYFTYEWKGVEYPGVRCGRCGFVFLRRRPTAAALVDLYGASYFESDYHCGHEEKPYFAAEESQTRSANSLLAWIEGRRPPGRILELGCAGGYFLDAARGRGWQATGLEISDEAATFARRELHLDVRTGTLEDVSFPDASFDAVYMGDVLEHVADPLRTLRETSRILQPEGVVLIAGPFTVNSLDRRLGLIAFGLLGRVKRLRQPPYHLSEFTPRTLRLALSRAGFRVIWVRQQKIPPAWRNPRHRPLGEHLAKLALDMPNAIVTRLTGRLGDRGIVLAERI